jgi:hypothetical protein
MNCKNEEDLSFTDKFDNILTENKLFYYLQVKQFIFSLSSGLTPKMSWSHQFFLLISS